jgi:hypothetical protein
MNRSRILMAVVAIAGFSAVCLMTPRQLFGQVRAAFVRDIDHPSRQPVVIFSQINVVAGNLGGNGDIFIQPAAGPSLTSVPAGKRLVIEFIAFRSLGFSPGDSIQSLHINSSLFGSSRSTPIQVTRHINSYTATHMVRIFGGPGTTLGAQILRSSTGLQEIGLLEGSGYLVDVE